MNDSWRLNEFESFSKTNQKACIKSLCLFLRQNPRAYFDLPSVLMQEHKIVQTAIASMRRMKGTLRDDTSVPSKKFVESTKNGEQLLQQHELFYSIVSNGRTSLSSLNHDVLSKIAEFIAGDRIDYLKATRPVVDFLHRHCIWDDYSICWENRVKEGPLHVQPMDVVFGRASLSMTHPGNVLFERLVSFFQGLFHSAELSLRPIFTRHLVSVMALECETLFLRCPRGVNVLPRNLATMKVVEHMLVVRTKSQRRKHALEAFKDPTCRRIIARTLQLTVPDRADRVLTRLVRSLKLKSAER